MLTSAEKTHKVSTESVTRFSDMEVSGGPSQTYYGGGQISELRSVGESWKMETASTRNALEKSVHEGARKNGAVVAEGSGFKDNLRKVFLILIFQSEKFEHFHCY